jgi:hypothetical protein
VCVKLNRNGSKTTGIEPYIIECMCLRLHEKESLSYLSERGYEISAAELYRLKQEVKNNSDNRSKLQRTDSRSKIKRR